MNPHPTSRCPAYDPCRETKLLEIGSGAIALWWSLLLLLPVHLFATNAAFGYLPHVGPEWKWGLGSLLVGVWQMSAVLRRRPLWRWLGACLSASLWGGLCACLGAGSRWEYHLPINTGCGVYATLVLLAFAAAGMLAPYVLADLSLWEGRQQAIWAERMIRYSGEDKNSGEAKNSGQDKNSGRRG